MSQGIAIISGSTVVHKLLQNGVVSLSGSIGLSGSVSPDGDGIVELGSTGHRWADVHAVKTTVGAIFEKNLRTENLGKLSTGTVVCWKNGSLYPCQNEGDRLVIGVVENGKDEPIIMGAEFILVTGEVSEGDLLITSSKEGHAKAVDLSQEQTNIIGKVIGQALENSSENSKLIKCMIKKM